MKTPKAKIKLAPTPLPSIFQIAVRQRGAKVAATKPKSAKREKIFSKSRDTREDRGVRQVKMTNNSQTFSH